MKFSKPKLSIRLTTRLPTINTPFTGNDKWNLNLWKIKDGFLVYKGKIKKDCTLLELEFLISWQCIFDQKIIGEVIITDKNQQHNFIFVNKKLKTSTPELRKAFYQSIQPKFNLGTIGISLDDSKRIHSNILIYSLINSVMKRGF